MDCIVHVVTKSLTGLNNFHFLSSPLGFPILPEGGRGNNFQQGVGIQENRLGMLPGKSARSKSCLNGRSRGWVRGWGSF